MIPLTRIRTAPPIHPNFFGTKRRNRNFKLLKQKRDGILDGPSETKWDSGFWKMSKDQLLVETNDKCAYCETPTKVVAFGDVEHFRPKSKYWWLAYCYDNYLASCAICNQKYKKDFFEIVDENLRQAGPPVAATASDANLKALAKLLTNDPVDDAEGSPLQTYIDDNVAEKPLLINPYFEDPAEFLAYKPILANKEVVVVATKTKHKPVVKACEDLFGINRVELMSLRFQWYCLYMTFRHTINDPGISANTRAANQNRIAQMLSPKSAYAGMVAYLESKPLAQLPWDFNIQIDL